MESMEAWKHESQFREFIAESSTFPTAPPSPTPDHKPSQPLLTHSQSMGTAWTVTSAEPPYVETATDNLRASSVINPQSQQRMDAELPRVSDPDQDTSRPADVYTRNCNSPKDQKTPTPPPARC